MGPVAGGKFKYQSFLRDDTCEWEASPPFVDYRRLAIEVATRIAPDLQETLANTVQASLNQLQAQISTHASRLGQLERRIGDLEGEKAALLEEVNLNAAAHTRLELKVDDLENRSRRNNLRLVGLPELVSPSDLQYICEVEIPKALGLDHRCRVERAHRIGPDRRIQSTDTDREQRPPRQVIMRFLDFNDKSEILRVFRKRDTRLLLRNVKVLLFEDYSAEVAKKRRTFSEICSQLFRKKIRFRLQYPTTLLVFWGTGPPQSYVSTEDAEHALRDSQRQRKTSTTPRPPQTARLPIGNGRGSSPPSDLDRSTLRD